MRDALLGLAVGGGIGLVLVAALLWPLARWDRAPRFTDRPASHAVAHAKGEPCVCYPRTPDTGSYRVEGGPR